MARPAKALTTEAGLMPPPPPRPPKRKKVVMDEDEYVAALGRIIECDFFPDLPILRARLGALESLGGAAEGATPTPTPGLGPTPTPGAPRGSTTPGTVPPSALGLETPSATPSMAATGATPGPGQAGPRRGHSGNLSLDAFLSAHTSEDNASFADLQEEWLRRKRSKQAHYLEGGGAAVPALEAGADTDGYGTTGQAPDTQELWPRVARNMLYYGATGAELAPRSAKEVAEASRGPPKEVRHENTRFPGADGAADARELEAVGTALAIGGGGEDGATYGMLATPSPAPGVQESPLMTWGELGSTPTRLPGDATPFRIQALPQRDRLGQALAHVARKSLSRKKAAGGPEPASPAVRTPVALSAAGRRLVKEVRRSRTPVPDADMQLRASYSRTPRKGTPQGKRTPAVTPLATPRDRPAIRVLRPEEPERKRGNITDDLLNI